MSLLTSLPWASFTTAVPTTLLSYSPASVAETLALRPSPHGAGRLLSRKEAFDNLNVENYKKEMEGIYSTSVNKSTLDEAPMVYKSIESILKNIEETVEIVDIIKPIYNFKAH